MNGKKESLFKQKLRQAKVDKQQKEQKTQMQNEEIQTFPQVFKIDKFDVNSDSDYKIFNQANDNSTGLGMIKEKYEQTLGFEQMTYLNKHREGLQNVISEDQLNQINNQNWNAVDSMNQEERNNYVNLIENTLPKHFIQKLKKKSQIKQQKSTHQASSSSSMIPEINKMSMNEVHKDFQKESKVKQLFQTKQGNFQKQNQQQPQDQAQNHKAIMDNIHLNIKTGKLCYLHENVQLTLTEDEKNTLVNRAKIYEMLTSDNNQSQIIGSELTLTWVKNIFPSQNIVFFVDKIPFHTKIMLSEIYQLLKVMETNIKSTKFYSCYIELLVKSVQILTCIFKNLSDSQLEEQLKFVEMEFEKSQKSLKDFINSNSNKSSEQSEQSNQKQSKQMLYESIGIMYQSLKEQKLRRQQILKNIHQQIEIEEKFQNVKNDNKIDDLIESILIEQTLKKEEFQLYELNPSINNFLQTSVDYFSSKIKANLQNLSEKLSEAHQFYNLFYRLVCKFAKKKKGFPFYSTLIKNIFSGLLEVLESQYLKLILEEILSKNFTENLQIKKNKSLSMLKSSITFKILFIYRELSCNTDKLAVFLQNSKSNWVISEEETNIIVYINFCHYLQAQDLKAQQIQMLQKMLEWVKVQLKNKKNKQSLCFLESEETLTSLLGLFLSSEQQVYSLIDQILLNDVFRQAVSYYESEVRKNDHTDKTNILTEQQIKRMIQNYNYNSFGNDIFTKVMFWVAVTFSPQTQALIAEEVMMRYPMLFYYASEPLKIENQGPIKSTQIKDLQNQIVLLGNACQYAKINNKTSKDHFTYKSNEQVKANLIKLLFMSLDFTEAKKIDNQSLQKILSQQAIDQTKGFNMKKNKLNEENYFYRYLIQPFVKLGEYKQFF